MRLSFASLIALAISGACLVAADDQSIINSNEYLTMQAVKADNDVNNINIVNEMAETQLALNDLQEIINAIGIATQVAQGAAASTDEGEEDSIEDTYSEFTPALVGLAHDILSKKAAFQLNLDEKKVHDSIDKIRNLLVSYDEQLVQKVVRQSIEDAIDQATTLAFTELGKTEVDFEN